MSETLQSPRHHALCAALAERRLAAGLTQLEVAKRLGRYQSYIAHVESGQRRIDVVEFLALAEAIGFNPTNLIKRLFAIRS